MSATGACPGCGAPLVFRVQTSVVTVCEHCRSVVARGDTTFEDIGKTNDILSTGSVLKLGLKGTLRASGEIHAFEIVGRTQLKHPLGGVWDEWYATVGGRWVWIAEHQGKLALTSEKDPQQGPKLSLASARPGKQVFTARGMMRIIEKGIATVVAEEGELPWRAEPNERRAFVDLSGPDGSFGTLDLGKVENDVPQGPVKWYLGRETNVDELGLRDSVVSEPVLRKVEANQHINCPQCQAPLELHLAETESVACPSCASALSVEDNGKLRFLFAQSKRVPEIPLGTKATLDTDFFRHAEQADEKKPLKVEVVAYVIRMVVFDGIQYEFDEYLLHTEKDGFFWLVQSDGHWSFTWPLNAGAVQSGGYSDNVRYGGRTFKPYQRSSPTVKYVAGELYWKVTVGEQSEMLDLIRPPYMLSEERTTNEVNWSKSLYIDTDDVRRVFRVPSLAKPSGVGGNQPSPWGEALRTGALLAAAASLVVLLLTMIIPGKTLIDQNLELTPPSSIVSTDPGNNKFSIAPLRLSGAKNVVVDLYPNMQGNAWVSGDLYQQSTGRIPRSFARNLDFGHQRVYLSAPPGGDYALNLLVKRSIFQTTSSLRLIVSQGHPSMHWLSMLGICLALSWGFLAYRYSAFEKARMFNSTFGGGE
jgi:hypothetical protein